jgi:NADP-dependent 3-hydroxy acid dehydrogenase YdfG
MKTRRLDDETAFITGASAGIGKAIAHELAGLGAKLVLGARRTDKLEAVAADIRAKVPGAQVLTHALDVTQDASVEAWLAAGEAFSPCTILVNNAGLALGRQRIDEADIALWDTMLDTNIRAAFVLVRKALPAMLRRGRGDVVMMASVAGLEPYANGAVYCASKAALQAFSRSLRAELLGKDLRVLTFAPGMVETEFTLVRTGGDVAAAKKVYEGMRPLTPEDIADCVAFSLTRPRHMSVDSMLILANDQLGTQTVYRGHGEVR